MRTPRQKHGKEITDDDLLSTWELAHLLRVSPSAVLDGSIGTSRLRRYRPRQKVYFFRSEVETFLAKQIASGFSIEDRVNAVFSKRRGKPMPPVISLIRKPGKRRRGQAVYKIDSLLSRGRVFPGVEHNPEDTVIREVNLITTKEAAPLLGITEQQLSARVGLTKKLLYLRFGERHGYGYAPVRLIRSEVEGLAKTGEVPEYRLPMTRRAFWEDEFITIKEVAGVLRMTPGGARRNKAVVLYLRRIYFGGYERILWSEFERFLEDRIREAIHMRAWRVHDTRRSGLHWPLKS
jgi:hypothetical protein